MTEGAARPPAPRHHLESHRSVAFAVLSVSDTHTEEDDPSGHLARELLTQAGHTVLQYRLVANSIADVRDTLEPMLDTIAIEAVVTVGGTGVSSRDLTINAIEGMGGRLIPGFGEIYRSLSHADVGPVAILSRASLFVVKLKPVFALPGSERAVRMAIETLIGPAVPHLVDELER